MNNISSRRRPIPSKSFPIHQSQYYATPYWQRSHINHNKNIQCVHKIRELHYSHKSDRFRKSFWWYRNSMCQRKRCPTSNRHAIWLISAPFVLHCKPQTNWCERASFYSLPQGCIYLSIFLCCFVEVLESGKTNYFSVNLRCKREVKGQTYSLSTTKASFNMTIDFPLAATFHRLSCFATAYICGRNYGVQLTQIYSSELKHLLWSTIISMWDSCLRFSWT